MQYEYNAHNKVERITKKMPDSDDLITEFYYYQMGNLTGTQDAEGNDITYDYDDLGRRIKTTRYFGEGQKIETTFEYYPPNTYNPNNKENPGQFSPSNRLKSITDDKGKKPPMNTIIRTASKKKKSSILMKALSRTPMTK